jgi:hypothetical protein
MNWTTRIEWRAGQNWVVLSLKGVVFAEMSLDDWAALSATHLLIEEARLETEQLQREAAAKEVLHGHG